MEVLMFYSNMFEHLRLNKTRKIIASIKNEFINLSI